MRFPARVGARQGRPVAARTASSAGHAIMLDIVFVSAGLAFFGVAAGYAILCQRL
ncbi:hypothetical protein [Methylobacterium haplocladii]|uniref:Uncharacterized protein n=1 Tax=Methylobacterium haplocladii TaxID=1176176 RepID=A0A512IMC2_9HYPH|nr:hypothetical protein [Methylobacterium haplocladii]GEO98798.1 hypothetical protein MHA02_11860 [Methylobacterium haplocladii]GJD84729.1 hypothetical protein HPGCJGGD_2611 [Methylobacterium haplocladii]GLS60234.1 hypothetical protein GCM10007887_29120 [Methylobacterium haplocladii]